MRKEIADLSRKLEIQRIRNMAWWPQSEIYRRERKASEPVFRVFWEARQKMEPELCRLLDNVEEEMYLLKEAELQATYLQGFSDCLDYLEKKEKRNPFRRVS